MDSSDEDEAKLVLDDDDDGGGDAELDPSAMPSLSRRKPRALRALEGADEAVAALNRFIVKTLDTSRKMDEAFLFVDPVDPSALPEYYDEIPTPTDIGMMRLRASKNGYWSVAEFHSDLDLMLSNCRAFNSPEKRPDNAPVLEACEALIPRIKTLLLEQFGGQENVDANETLIATERDKLPDNPTFRNAPRDAIRMKPQVRKKRAPPAVPRQRRAPATVPRKPKKPGRDDEEDDGEYVMGDEGDEMTPAPAAPSRARARSTGAARASKRTRQPRKKRFDDEDELSDDFGDEDDEDVPLSDDDDDEGSRSSRARPKRSVRSKPEAAPQPPVTSAPPAAPLVLPSTLKLKIGGSLRLVTSATSSADHATPTATPMAVSAPTLAPSTSVDPIAASFVAPTPPSSNFPAPTPLRPTPPSASVAPVAPSTPVSAATPSIKLKLSFKRPDAATNQ